MFTKIVGALWPKHIWALPFLMISPAGVPDPQRRVHLAHVGTSTSQYFKAFVLLWLRVLLCCLLWVSLNACSQAPTSVLTPVGTLEVPYAIQSMAWHPNGKWLAVGYFNRDEVQVWDVQNKKALFAVPSKRSPVNQSGQEVLFSADGKYLVVQDFVDTKNGEPKFPKNYEDPAEISAQNDKERYILARTWDVEQRKEIMQIKGPGSSLYGGGHEGMCWLSSKPFRLALLRETAVAVYEPLSGTPLYEINLRFPFKDKPDFNRSYDQMSCRTNQEEIALNGGPLMKKAPVFGYPENSGATPIVVVDMALKSIKKVLFSATPLNGVAYTADGSKLVSFGVSPIRVWDANKDFSPVGEIKNPPKWLWLHQHGIKVDMLNPPANIPVGNAGNFVSVAGTDLMFGLSGDLYLWNTATLKAIHHHAPKLPDIFRIAGHQPTGTFAVADGRVAHLFHFSRSAFEAQQERHKQ